MNPVDVITRRLRCVHAKLAGHRAVRHVSSLDVLQRLFSIEGLRKRWLRARARVEPGDRFDRVTVGSVSVWWPRGASLSRLVDIYDETFLPRNHHQFERFGTRVDPGDIVLDCGACEGYFARKVLDRCARIYLVEPSPVMQQCLSRTFRDELRSGRAEIVGAFLGDRDGEIAFVENEEDPALNRVLPEGETHPFALVAPIRKIDTLAAELGMDRLEFIKADVEGQELQLICGAEQTIRRWRPKIAITTYHDPDHADKLVELITAFDSAYRFRIKGIMAVGKSVRPIMAHFWVD